jgi:hypothetical protein
VPWTTDGWDSPPAEAVVAFVRAMAALGWYIELTLLTDDNPARIGPAMQLVAVLAAARLSNLLLEIGNEPETNKNIQTTALRAACEASGYLFSSGNYENSAHYFGSYLTDHSPRDGEWPRKAKNAREYYDGGGPNAPTDPAHHVPIVEDEPAKWQDVGGPNVTDWRAYFGVASINGAGATFHSESGKQALPPTVEEAQLAVAALEGLTAFPEDAPLGGYRRIDEGAGSLRTYIIGGYMVRVRPTTPNAPESGWQPLDSNGILWRRG